MVSSPLIPLHWLHFSWTSLFTVIRVCCCLAANLRMVRLNWWLVDKDWSLLQDYLATRVLRKDYWNCYCEGHKPCWDPWWSVQAVMPSLMILQLHALDWWCTYPRACCELVANTTKAGAFSGAILSLVTKAGAFSRAILSPWFLSLVLWPLGILSSCILLDLSSTLLRQGIFTFRQRLEPPPGLSCLWWQGLEPPPGLSCHQVSSFKCSFCGKDIAILYWFTVIVPALVSQALTSFTILSLWLELVGVVSWMTITNQLSLTTVAFSLLQSS